MKEPNEMFDYYDERASEYDGIYEGHTPGMPEADLYKKDVEKIKSICGRFGKGHLIDVACGTAYWLPYYASNCSEITLVDQSRHMLAACRKRVNSLNLDISINYIKSDFFEVRFLSKVFDSAVVAFLMSHLTEEATGFFIDKLRRILNPRASVLWIDGSWSPIRKKYRDKSGLQERKLENGRAFSIFKRYFDEHDIESFLHENSLVRKAFYFGDVFFAVSTVLAY
ncbi:MAG: class I SAM-dependent methyltransferase [candidate division WOR-3 bacterium]|nr:MAG: class I SAM-dependent methyltransferase [candidate division WOR-3 bacterium]